MEPPLADDGLRTSLSELRRQLASDVGSMILQQQRELQQHIEGYMARHERVLASLASKVDGAGTIEGSGRTDESAFPRFTAADETPDLPPARDGFREGALSSATARFAASRTLTKSDLTYSYATTATRRTHQEEDASFKTIRKRANHCCRRVCLRNSVRQAVLRPSFDYLISGIILVNAITVGIEVEQDGSDLGRVAGNIQNVCNAIFIVELLLRLLAHGQHYFFGEEWAWNVLDTVLVLFSVVEMVAAVADGNSRANAFDNIKVVRVIRVIRVVRIMRVIRLMRFFRALRMLVHSIFATLKSLMYAVMLLLLIIYAFAVIFTQVSLDHYSTDAADGISAYYGSVMQSILTLFMCISGGVNWGLAFKPLQDIHWSYTVLFIFYIVFSTFAVLNVMTGQFCQSAIESAKHDDEEVIAEQLAATTVYTAKLRRLFNQITEEESQDGGFSLQTFEAYLEDRRVQAYFRSLEIEPIDAWTIFKLLDENNANEVQLEQFVTGCLRLRGVASTIGLKELMYELRNVSNFMSGRLDRIERALQVHWTPMVNVSGEACGCAPPS